MSPLVELVYDCDCPNVEAARKQLSEAFSELGMSPQWEEWDRNAEESPPDVRRYGSPTVLVDRRDVSGDGSEADWNCCRVYTGPDGGMRGVPSVEAIRSALEAGFRSSKTASPNTHQ